MSKRDEQLARMKGLMTYGIVSENKKTPVKDSIEGPDGNIYAIIREGAKYYIKSTPKGSALVTESFDYIGGFMNKKANEFSSYNQASKNLELKVRSLNEAYGINKTVEVLNPEKKETLMVEMTDAMKASIARYRQIMNNAAGIMNESSSISTSNTGVPEAPKTTAFSPKLGEPFTKTAEAKLDSDLKTTANNPEKQGEPFGDNEKAEEYKDAQYVPDGSVANKKPSGGKVVRVNENEEYEETIEDCDEWGSCGLPASAGTGEIGDDAPFTETLKEDNFFHNDSLLDEITINEDEPAGFADEETTNEDEEDIDLDDIDLDLDTEAEPDADEELDDIDTEETLDDEDILSDENEDDDIESLKARVAELEELVHQLIGDEDADIDFDDEDFDFEDEVAENDEEEMFPESKQYIQRLVEDVVQYLGDNGREDTFDDRRPGKNCWGEAIAHIEEMGLPFSRERYSINCVKNIYRLWKNLQYLESSGEANEENIAELSRAMDLEMRRLVANTNGNESSAIETIQVKVDGWLDKMDAMFNEPTDADFEMDTMPDDESSEMPEENDTDIDAVGFEDEPEITDDEKDAMAYAGAEDFDPSMYESRNIKGKKLNEEGTRLNVFGKHPGYRKKPMSLPQTGSDEGDWNDESVYSEQPFGQAIGDSAPFKKVVNASVDAVMESLKKKL